MWFKKLRVDVDGDVDVGANGFAYGGDMRDRIARRRVEWHVRWSLYAHLERGVAVLFDHRLGVFAGLPRCGAARALVHADLVAHPAADERRHWHAKRLARDIPEGVLDAAHGGIGNDAAWKTRGVVHQVEDVLHIARVVANQPQLEVFDDFHHRFIGARGIRLADPVNALVGENFYVNPVAAAGAHQECLDVGDLHGGHIADLPAIQWLQPLVTAADGTSCHSAAAASSGLPGLLTARLSALRRCHEWRSGYQAAAQDKASSLHVPSLVTTVGAKQALCSPQQECPSPAFLATRRIADGLFRRN